jgi:hypothetical protein
MLAAMRSFSTHLPPRNVVIQTPMARMILAEDLGGVKQILANGWTKSNELELKAYADYYGKLDDGRLFQVQNTESAVRHAAIHAKDYAKVILNTFAQHPESGVSVEGCLHQELTLTSAIPSVQAVCFYLQHKLSHRLFFDMYKISPIDLSQRSNIVVQESPLGSEFQEEYGREVGLVQHVLQVSLFRETAKTAEQKLMKRRQSDFPIASFLSLALAHDLVG